MDLRVTSFVTLFTEEAIKLWHAERSTDTITTLAALNCLSVATGWSVLHLTSVIVHQAAIGLSLKLFFRLCFDYWKGVYVCYRVFASIVPAHLSIALQAGHHGKKARLLNHEFLAVGIHQRVADEVLTDSSVDFHKAIRKGTGAKMDELA
ncbi:hypothetical protein N0V87_004434, partial [Didymella glomerata]